MSWDLRHSHFSVIDSTQSEAKRALALVDHLPPRVMWVYSAECQRMGRGTHQRVWFSPPGVNLYATFVFKIARKDPALSALSSALPQNPIQHGFSLEQFPLCFPQVTAYTVAKTLKTFGVQAKMKWMNDLVVGKKKIAGILCEAEWKEKEIRCYIGIGLNVNMDQALCAEVEQPVTSMKIVLKRDIPKEAVFHVLQKNFVEGVDVFCREGFSPFYAPINRLLAFKHKQVAFEPVGSAAVYGTLMGIHPSGALHLRLENQKESVFWTGRLTVV